MRPGKVLTAIDMLLNIWKSDPSNEIKRNFSQAKRELHKNVTSYIE